MRRCLHAARPLLPVVSIPRLQRTFRLVVAVLTLSLGARGSANAQRSPIARPARDTAAVRGAADSALVTRSGRITLGSVTVSPRYFAAYLQGPAGAFRLYNRAPSNRRVLVGDSVEATGRLTVYKGMPELEEVRVRVLASPPRQVAAERVPLSSLDRHVNELVTVSGMVSEPSGLLGGGQLLLGDGSGPTSERPARVVVQTFSGAAAPVELKAFLPGDRISVTGVVAFREQRGVQEIALLPREPSDVRLEGISAHARRTAAAASLALVIGLLAIATWIGLLRREIRRRTDALVASEARYQQIFDASPAANFISTPAGELLACNARFAAMFGFASIADALSRPTTALYEEPAARLEFLDELQRNGQVENRESALRCVDGTTIHVRENVVARRDTLGRVVELHGFLLDLSEQRRLEEDFRQAQKMESIGRLAGGVAHDFNNMLTVILTSAELAFDVLARDHPARPDLDAVRAAAQRGVALTAQLLTFSRRQVLAPSLTDIASVVRNLSPLLQRLVGRDVTVEVTLPASLQRPVLVDGHHLEQAIVNLVSNARDAMPHGGRVRVGVDERTLDHEWVATHPGSEAGSFILVSVQDEGVGMDRETRTHALEPFFTTKVLGRGTGLGLSMVFGFVKQSGGFVTLESTLGCGTTASLFLPVRSQAIAPSAGDGDLPPRARAVGAPWATQRGTVLVVDDDEAVGGIVSRVLREAGYTVVQALDPREGLVAMRRLTTLDLVLTDVVMPNGGGAEVARHADSLFPGVPLIFMSGYTDDAVIRRGLESSAGQFLAKPFLPSVLRDAVKAAARPVTAARAGHAGSSAS